MTLFEQAMVPLRKYADFSGRASRAEFWIFFLFVAVIQAVARLVDTLLGSGFMPGPVAGLAGLLLIMPQLAVTVRRLHDVNRPARELVVPGLMLLALPLFIVFSGVIAKIVALGYFGLLLIMFANLLLLLAKQGSSIPNRYGASPTAFSFAKAKATPKPKRR